MLNSISNPDATGKPKPTGHTTELRGIRALLYFHLAVIILLAAFSLQDRGLLKLPESIAMLFHTLPIQLVFLISPIACPVVMLIAAARLKDRSIGFRAGVVALDSLLSLFQFWVMLPLVQ